MWELMGGKSNSPHRAGVFTRVERIREFVVSTKSEWNMIATNTNFQLITSVVNKTFYVRNYFIRLIEAL
jgi:hypothetical protein